MSANYRNPNWLLPNEKNLKQPASGTVTGSGLAEDRKSLYSMNFDGVDSIEIPDTTLVNNFTSVSFSFWVNVETPTAYDGIVCSRTGSSEYILTYIDNISGSDFKIVIQQKSASGGTHTVTTSATLTAGNWYNIVCTGTVGGKWDLYVNRDKTGQVQSSATITAITQGANFIIGRDPGAAGRGLQGKIDEVAIWNKALNQSEIDALSTANAPANLMALSAKPFAYYPLGEFAGNSGEKGGTPSGQTNSWKFPNQAIKDYVFDFVSSDYITMGNILTKDGSTAFSISGWIKYTGAGTMMIVSTQDASGIGYLLHTGNFAGVKLCWYPCIASGGNIQVRTSNAYNDGNWHNILATYDGSGNASGAKIYVDGTLDTNIITDTFTGTSSSTGPFQISARNGASFPFVGEVSNVAVWNSDQSTNKDNIYNNGSPQSTYTTTPEAWYKLNAATSSYNPATSTWTITDSAGSNNGTSTTLSSTSLIPSDLQFESPYSNFSLDFDGTGNFINCGAISELASTTNFSLSGWFYFDSVANNKTLYSYGSSTGPQYSMTVQTHASGNLIFVIASATNDSGSNYIQTNLASVLTTSTWYHIVCTYDGDQAGDTDKAKIYINGTEVAYATGGGTIPATTSASTGPFNIGQWDLGGSNRFFNGKIDETAIWSSTLTATQVNQVYNNGRPGDLTSLSPISWWRLGEDAFFVNNNITIPNQISGGPTGTGSGTQTAMLSADAPQSYGSGYGVGLAVTDKIGDAPESTANSLSYNMIPDNRHPYTPGYAPAKVDNAFSMNFDFASLSHLNIGKINALNSTTYFSLSVWVKPGSGGGANKEIFTIANSTAESIVINYFGADLIYGVGTTGQFNRVASGLSTGVWAHLCFVFDGSQSQSADKFKLYRNGAYVTPNSGGSISATSTANFTGDAFIGAWALDQTNFTFDGHMDEFAIFDYALTAKQIKEDIYNASTTGKTADLSNNSNLTAPVAWYRMGD